MEYSSLLHQPFAKGRIENKLPPAPKKQKRFFLTRWLEALSVLRGNSIAVRCYKDIEPREGEEYSDGTVGRHKLLGRN